MRDWKIVTGQRIKPKACEAVPVCMCLVMAHNYLFTCFFVCRLMMICTQV